MQIEIRMKKKDAEGGNLEVMYRREYTLEAASAAEKSARPSCTAAKHRRAGHAVGDRVISPVAVRLAPVALFLDVIHLAIRGELAVATDDAAAAECGESEEPNKTTHSASVARD